MCHDKIVWNWKGRRLYPQEMRKGSRKNVSVSKAIYISTEIIKSQNHRTLEVGRYLWKLSSAAPLLRDGHQGQVTQDHVQLGLKYLQGQRQET